MRGNIRKEKRAAFYIRKLLPPWLVRLIVKAKGAGVRERPVDIRPNNPRALACTIAYNQYGAFCTPDSCKYDSPVQTTYRGLQYEQQTIDYIKSLKLDGDIIHAGAYFGDTVPALASVMNSGATLWAFEPNEESYRCAEITTLLNSLENVVLQKLAIGDKEGTLHLQLTNSDQSRNLGGTARIVSKENSTTQAVHVVTLDTVIPKDRKISLIHLDVEGFEEQALAGAANIIETHAPVIVSEVNEKTTEQVLEKFGYTFETSLEEREQREGFRNAVFVKK